MPLSALLVLAWAQASETPWPAIGFVRPKSWLTSVAIGLVFGGLFKLMMKAVVMPLLGAPAENATYHYLAGNAAALPFTLYAVIIGAGFGEETVFRGFLFERLGKLLGTSRRAKIAIVLITAACLRLRTIRIREFPALSRPSSRASYLAGSTLSRANSSC